MCESVWPLFSVLKSAGTRSLPRWHTVSLINWKCNSRLWGCSRESAQRKAYFPACRVMGWLSAGTGGELWGCLLQEPAPVASFYCAQGTRDHAGDRKVKASGSGEQLRGKNFVMYSTGKFLTWVKIVIWLCPKCFEPKGSKSKQTACRQQTEGANILVF